MRNRFIGKVNHYNFSFLIWKWIKKSNNRK